jgi:hypothetical protein
VIVERLVRIQLRAMGCERFDIGIKRDAGEMNLREGQGADYTRPSPRSRLRYVACKRSPQNAGRITIRKTFNVCEHSVSEVIKAVGELDGVRCTKPPNSSAPPTEGRGWRKTRWNPSGIA